MIEQPPEATMSMDLIERLEQWGPNLRKQRLVGLPQRLDDDLREAAAALRAAPVQDRVEAVAAALAPFINCSDDIHRTAAEAALRAAAVQDGWRPDPATVEECAKVAECWLANFGHVKPEFIDPQHWAADAVRDIIASIRSLSNSDPVKT